MLSFQRSLFRKRSFQGSSFHRSVSLFFCIEREPYSPHCIRLSHFKLWYPYKNSISVWNAPENHEPRQAHSSINFLEIFQTHTEGKYLLNLEQLSFRACHGRRVSLWAYRKSSIGTDTTPNLHKTLIISLMTDVGNLRQTRIFQIQCPRTNFLTL